MADISRKELLSISLLVILYTLQGIPMGLSGSIPFLLADKISYKQQSLLSLASLPFSLKLLWAPIVDGVYSSKFGRRRSWLLPLQLIAGGIMIWASNSPYRLQTWLGDHEGADATPNVFALTCYFGCLYMLMATQDIAVDGWALTLLRPHNRGYASTCNTVGQTLGYCFAYVGFLALNDPVFCNRFLRSTPNSNRGVTDLGGFMSFWGWIFILTTLALLCYSEDPEGNASELSYSSLQHTEASCYAGPIGGGEDIHLFPDVVLGVQKLEKRNSTAKKTDNHDSEQVNDFQEDKEGSMEPSGVFESYMLLWKLFFSKPVQELVVIILTFKIPFAAVDAATQLKLIEKGVKKEEMAYFAPLIMPFSILCPIMVGKWITGDKPLKPFMTGYILRNLCCILWAGVVASTQRMYNSEYALFFYVFLIIVTIIYNICSDLMFVSQMAFFARISDPRIGGTYMTFLNTVSNIGSMWRTLSLWLMEAFTLRDCNEVESGVTNSLCPVVVDGYYTQLASCAIIGALWLVVMRKRINRLQFLDGKVWLVDLTPSHSEESPSLELKRVSKASGKDD